MIGMVTAGTGKSGFGPACAAAGMLAAPVSANAPLASTVLRLIDVMTISPPSQHFFHSPPRKQAAFAG
jgi:hypothetical protein